MLAISKKLFDSWNDNKLNYCHWKSNEHLIEGLNGITDLDVLLDINQKQTGQDLLRKLNFLLCKSQFGSRYPNVEDWIGFDSPSGKLIHLHLHYEMITGHKGLKEYVLPWTADVLFTKIKDEKTGVYISNPNYEILTLYTRLGLKAHYKQIKKAKTDTFSIGDDNIKEINYLKAKVEWSEVEKIVKKYYSSDSDLFLHLIQKSEISGSDFIQIKTITEKTFKKYNRYSSFGSIIRFIFHYIVSYFLRFIKNEGKYIITRKTPMSGKSPVITFMGQDGAGKSTVVKDVQKWLSWKLEVSQFYLGSGDHYQPWEKRLANHLHGSDNSVAKLIRKWLPFSYLSKLGKNVYETIVKANRYAAKGGIVLFDRYPQIEYVGINDGPKIRVMIMQFAKNGFTRAVANYYASKEEKYLKKAVAYSPDVVIKLMLSPEESIRRKPHEDYEMVKRKHEVVKSLKFDSAKVYLIDATQDYEKELIEIKNIIWDYLVGGYAK